MARINIQIEGLSIQEAGVVMKALTASVADVEVTGEAPPPEPVISSDTPARTVAHTAKPAAKGSAKSGAKGGSKTTTKPENTNDPSNKQLGKTAEEPAKGGAKGGANVVDLDAARGAGSLVDKLAKYTKLRDVVEVMREEGGFSDDAALVAECERIQEQVPAMKKIKSGLADRVTRVLERLSA